MTSALYLARRCLLSLTLLAITSQVSAWGPGHEDHLKLILDTLPQEMQTFFEGQATEERLHAWSHYPDSFDDFDEELVGKMLRQRLHDAGIPHRYALHHAEGRAYSFMLMVEAFREKNSEHALFWLACLAHAIGDEGACNHDPLIHYMTYAFRQYKVPLGEGIGLDLADLAHTKKGTALLGSLLADYTPARIADSPEEALLMVMMAGVEANNFMTQRGYRIAASYGLNTTEAMKDDARLALGELGAYGTKVVVDMACTAWRLAAQTGIDIVLTPDIQKRFKEKRDAYIRTRPLANDSIYTGLLEGRAGERPVGVLLEPSQTMNKGYFSFGGKLILAAIMREFHAANIPYRALDVRSLATDMPNAAELPVLVICAGRFEIPAAYREALQRYADEGGRILWIGGTSSPILGHLGRQLRLGRSTYMPPVSEAYGATHEEVYQNVSFVFQNSLGSVLGSRPCKFVNPPHTKAGWQRPRSNYYVDTTDERIIPLATAYMDGEAVMCVAAYAVDNDGQPTHCFLPEYLVAPYLLSKESPMTTPAQPRLDTISRQVFLGALNVLRETKN